MDDNFRITLANDSHVDAIFRLAEASEIGSMEKRNEAGGFLVSKFSENQYRTFITRADHFYVMADNERITGFLLAYSNGFIDSAWEVDAFINSTYPQPFVVIKQICIDKEFRRRGLAVRLYEHLIRQVPGHALFAAVVLEPYNYASVRFHERFGFQIVREITPRDGLPRAIWCRDPIDYGGLGDAAK